MKRCLLPFLFVVCALLPAAFAQSLRDLLPADTVFALGTQGLQENEGRLQGFIDEFNRLEIGTALQSVFASAAEDATGEDATGENMGDAMPEELQGLGILDVLGREAWLAVSLIASNPIPAVTVVARVNDEAQQALASLIAKEAAGGEVQTLSEGGITFYVETVDAGDGASSPAAYAQDGETFMLSSNVDVLRGILRRHQGGNEPSFTAGAGYQATLGTLGDGAFYTFLDLAPIGAAAKPFLTEQGFDSLATRLEGALKTAGVSGGVIRLTDEGTESQRVQVLGDASLDPALHALLSNAAPASSDPLSFTPGTALGVSSGTLDLVGWWDYLTGLIESAPQLGVTDVDQMLSSMTGLDLRASLFDWMGLQTGVITTGVSAPVQPGMPSSNLLGELVFLVQTNDEAAAATGLTSFFSTASGLVSSMTAASGDATAAPPSSRDVGGVAVSDYVMGPGISFSVAVTDGYALIATSTDAMDQALTAKAASGELTNTLAAMQQLVPGDARGYTVTDQKASVDASAGQIASQIQLAAGLGGSSDLDFDAIEAASGSIEQYLHFVATKLDGSVSYGTIDGDTITTTGSMQVAW